MVETQVNLVSGIVMSGPLFILMKQVLYKVAFLLVYCDSTCCLWFILVFSFTIVFVLVLCFTDSLYYIF